jgi:ABC-type amino acid transport substrate-binding protein
MKMLKILFFAPIKINMKTIILMIVPGLCILSLLSCSSPQGLASQVQDTKKNSIPPTNETINSLTDLEGIKSRGVLVVGTAITKPFEYYDPETEELTGFDVEIAKYVADKMGVRIEWIEMPFANLLPALEEQKVDMTIAAMYITEEREALVDFSRPYIKTGLVMVTQADSADEIQSIQDLAGRSVGVKIGATGEALAKEFIAQGIPLKLVEYQDSLDSLMDLEVGRVDVVFNDYLNTLIYINEYKSDLYIFSDPKGNINFLSQVGVGIAVHPLNQDLLNEINIILMDMEKTGITDKLVKTWLFAPNAQ